ncbi:MAG: radical SAM/SPASM domain-containing protein [Flavobacteriales bacterium]|nr:radical SAM/SPASM domain-containing protein [Flavobacteriales bacterium]
MARLTPDSVNPENRSSPFFDNTAMLAKVLYRIRSHSALFARALCNGASLKRLLITRAPFWFADSRYPPSMHVELTNACNLQCVYCNNPHFAHPRGVMDDRTLDGLIEGLRGSRVDRLCIGGGEPTLHPKFAEFVKRLRPEVRVLTIVTNGHWTRKGTAEAMVSAPIDFIEVSVEAGTAQDFEAMRVGANYAKFLANLRELRSLRDRTGSSSLINLRMMVRPSQQGRIERESHKYWSAFADSVMPQYVLKDDEIATIEDAFTPRSGTPGQYPKCTLPFRNLQVRWNGDVPICQISGSTLIPAKKVVTGNVKDHLVQDLWNGNMFKTYRHAHRTRDEAAMPICKGCKGC